MGKNTKLYRYLELGLKWNSWILARIERDGDHHQMSDQLGKLAALRLTEYYTLVDAGLIVPGLSMVNAPRAQVPSQAATNRPEPEVGEEPEYRSSRPSRQRQQEQEQPAPIADTILEESEYTDDNADALLDQMGFDDE